MTRSHATSNAILAPILTMLTACAAHGRHAEGARTPDAESIARAAAALRAKAEPADWARAARGVRQVAQLWDVHRDGSAEEFAAFCAAEFVASGPALEAMLDRLRFALERLGGYFNSMRRDLRRGADLEIGPLLPLDERLAAFDPGAHLTDDLFASKVAFVALLNFPVTTLAERLAHGMGWTRREWAEARLTRGFETRVPAEVNQRIAAAAADAEAYIAAYDLRMDRLVARDGSRPFPKGLRLISHWGLRDELKARYADPEGLEKQRIIRQVMERIVRQTIPVAVLGEAEVAWEPFSNRVDGGDAARELDVRYAKWMAVFRAHAGEDPYDPACPTHVLRRFERDREIPERQVRALFEEILDSPLGSRVASEISKRLGRPLEPFDIWYAGFKPLTKYGEAELDAITRERYPNAAAFAADLPRILGVLGFDRERARFLADHVVVEPSRGAGHAYGAQRRDDKAHLRTRIGVKGMDYKGYNIAIHELGHNVEQVFSQTSIDDTLLSGVPNTAFTEALAFVFQARDLECLGLEKPDEAALREKHLEDFWATREIAGVALVDMDAWNWLYAHPDATAAEFREAVVKIAEDVWNRWYAPLLGERDAALLAIYSHMVDAALYTPDYPLGHLIQFQVEDYFHWKGGAMGPEFERLAKLGCLTPDAWMRQAVGKPLSAEPLLRAAARALEAMVGR